MGSDEKHDIAWSIGFVILLVGVLVLLVTDPGRGLSQGYVSLFTGLFVAAIVGVIVLLIASKMLGFEEDEYTPTIISSSESRGLTWHWAFKVGGIIFLSIIFVGGSAVSQTSLIPIIDPLDSSTLITAENIDTVSGTFLNASRSGGYPGLAEDTIGFVFVSVVTLGLLWLFRKIVDGANSILPFVLFAGVVACGAWGFVFASAHQLAYGLSGNAYIAAFLYGFISQLVNFLVGAPVSVVAHFLHNFWIIFSAGVLLSLGGYLASNSTSTTAAGAFIMSKNPFTTPRRGQAAVWITIVAAIVLLGGAGAYLYNANNGGNTLEIQPACSDFQDIPGALSCSTASDCQAHFEGNDPNVNFRCENSICQVKFNTCSQAVTP